MADHHQNPTLTEASATSSPSVLPHLPSAASYSNSSIDHHPLQITHHKLNGSNFREWSQSVMLVIKGKGKSGYLTGFIPSPSTIVATYGVWEAENSTIMA